MQTFASSWSRWQVCFIILSYCPLPYSLLPLLVNHIHAVLPRILGFLSWFFHFALLSYRTVFPGSKPEDHVCRDVYAQGCASRTAHGADSAERIIGIRNANCHSDRLRQKNASGTMPDPF